jgi:hypothetical protein
LKCCQFLHLHSLVHTRDWIDVAERCCTNDYANGGGTGGGIEDLGSGPGCGSGRANTRSAGTRALGIRAGGGDLSEAEGDGACCCDCLSLLRVQSEPDWRGLRVTRRGENEENCREDNCRQSGDQVFPSYAGLSRNQNRQVAGRHDDGSHCTGDSEQSPSALVKRATISAKKGSGLIPSLPDLLTIAGPKL